MRIKTQAISRLSVVGRVVAIFFGQGHQLSAQAVREKSTPIQPFRSISSKFVTMTTAQKAAQNALRGGLQGVDENMKCIPAGMFVMSCGCVTLDLERGLLLIIYNAKLGIWQIPKGRRNIGEPMIEAAFRETYEETGWRPKPLAVKMSTRASQPKTERGGKKVDVVELCLDNEPIAECTYECPQATTPGVIKTIYYYPAACDSTSKRDLGTQEDHEHLEPHWFPITKAVETLTFRAEKGVIERAMECVKKTGYAIGGEEAKGKENQDGVSLDH
ncbi:NUDIX hydrolase domain-like protein [Cladorrhinum sp. PSN332]|nr:NUDIX hydrolase domain-like protein [Cladorrhinum sp. PSN332]